MATIRNESGEPITLSDGHVLSPGDAPYNVDPTLPLEASLISSRRVVVIDPNLSPPIPAEPLANVPRRAFLASAQPGVLDVGDLWFRTDPVTGLVIDVLEAT